MNKTFIDPNGYKRFKHNNKLIHREIAYKFCKHHPGLKFSDCEVHHIDKNKLNNHYSNLIILSNYEHFSIHKLNESLNQVLNNRKKNKTTFDQEWKEEKILYDLELFENEYIENELSNNNYTDEIILNENLIKSYWLNLNEKILDYIIILIIILFFTFVIIGKGLIAAIILFSIIISFNYFINLKK